MPPAPQRSTTSSSGIIECRRLPPNFASLGQAFDFVVMTSEFGRMQARVLFNAVKAQIVDGRQVAAFRDGKLVGYCGWLTTTEEIGRRWLEGAGKLLPVPPGQADAVALTIVRIIDRAAVLPAIRSCRQLNASRRVFFKRENRDRDRTRKSSVRNA